MTAEQSLRHEVVVDSQGHLVIFARDLSVLLESCPELRGLTLPACTASGPVWCDMATFEFGAHWIDDPPAPSWWFEAFADVVHRDATEGHV